MSKRNILTAIDVGTTKVCTIVANSDEGSGIRVIGVGIAPSEGLHKGLVVNISEAREAIRESVRRAEETSGHKVESAYVGVTGRHVTSLNNRAVVAITRNDRLVRPDDLKRVLTSARGVKLTADRKLLHVIPRGYAVDGQSGVKDPVGMHGFRLDVETHIITAAVTSVQNLVKCVRGIGLDIDDLILEPLASSEAVLSEDEKQAGVILADIGGGTTDIAIFKEGSIWHTAILPVAGYQITRDISVGLDLSFELAEEMKKKYGNVLPGEDDKDNDQTLTEDGHSVSYRDLSEIVRVRVEELLRLIVLELPRSDYSKLVPAGLVLTGGSSNLPGLAELAAAVTRLPVRIGVPMNLYGVADSLYDPAYATSVGLVMWKTKRPEVGVETWQKKKGMRNWVSRFFSLFK